MTIMNGDCVEKMKLLPDDSVDSIITDPPYALTMASWDTFKTLEHFHEWCLTWATEAFRVVKPGGTIAVFNAAKTYHWVAMALDKAGFECRDMVEWVYWTGMPKGKNLKGCHEPIYIGWKPTKKVGDMTFNIDDVRIPVKEKKKKGDEDTTIVSVGKLDFETREVGLIE